VAGKGQRGQGFDREGKGEGVVNIWGIWNIGGVVAFCEFEGRVLNSPVNWAVHRAVKRFSE
jgi:hypothetical protein